MYFQVQQIDKTLIVNSDTFWSCNAYGSIRLSKYSGSGDDTIRITLPDDMSFGFGRVVFSYGDGRCEYPAISVYVTNECWVKTTPMYDSNNEVNLFYTEDNEPVSMKVFSNSPWYVQGNNAYTNDDEVLIQADEDGKEVIIKPFNCGKQIKVILCKKTE